MFFFTMLTTYSSPFLLLNSHLLPLIIIQAEASAPKCTLTGLCWWQLILMQKKEKKHIKMTKNELLMKIAIFRSYLMRTSIARGGRNQFVTSVTCWNCWKVWIITISSFKYYQKHVLKVLFGVQRPHCSLSCFMLCFVTFMGGHESSQHTLTGSTLTLTSSLERWPHCILNKSSIFILLVSFPPLFSLPLLLTLLYPCISVSCRSPNFLSISFLCVNSLKSIMHHTDSLISWIK